MTQPMIDDVLEIIENLEIAAPQLWRLARGSLKNGSDSILLKEVYQFGTKIRTAPCFPRDDLAEEFEKKLLPATGRVGREIVFGRDPYFGVTVP
jgi:hypothetical protein